MNKITIGFSRSSGKFPIFSWLIMLAQGNNFSHAYMRFHLDSYDKELVFQASGISVNLVNFELFKEKEEIVKEFELEISDEAFDNIMKSAIDLLGQPYSMKQILNSAIYILTKKSPFNDQINGWDCSKLIAYELQKELGYPIIEDLDVITPKDLYNFLETTVNK